MNQSALIGKPQPAAAQRAGIERPAGITNSQVVHGDNNVVIWGDGNTVVQKVISNQKPIVSRLPAPVVLGRPDHSIRLLDRTDERKTARNSMTSGVPLEFFGTSGLGKSTLLRFLASTLNLPDGMVFLELRNTKKLEDIHQELFEAFFQCDQNYMPNEVELKRCFVSIHALILLDDSNLSREELQSLRYMLPSCMLVTTSAEQHLWGEGVATELAGLPTKDALALFQQQLGRKLTVGELPQAQRICATLQGNPLKIIQTAANIRTGKKSTTELAAQLSGPIPDDALTKVSVSKLPSAEKNLLAILAVIQTAPLPAEHLAELLHTSDLSPLVKDLLERGLIKAHSPRYSLTDSMSVFLPQVWDLTRWNEVVLQHFLDWSSRSPSSDQVIEAADATLAVLENAARLNRWQEVFRIGQAIEPLLILSRRWGEWARLLPYLLRAGQALGQHGIEAWALHQLGSRALCMGQLQPARDYLTRALEIRKAIGDKSGIQATQHNLAQLSGGGAPPRNPPHPRSGPTSFNGWIVGLVIGAAILGFYLFGPPLLPQEPTRTPTANPITPSTATQPSPTGSTTGTATATPTITPTPTISPTPTPACPNPPAFTFSQDANCRTGPGTAYGRVTSLNQGQIVSIVGQNPGDPRWWLVAPPDFSGERCWVSYVTGSTCGSLEKVPIIIPPTFTPTPTPAPAPPVIQYVDVFPNTDSIGNTTTIDQVYHFIDPDGDTNFIQILLISVSPTSVPVNTYSGNVSVPSNQQRVGATTNGTWTCQGNVSYTVELEAILWDAQGLSSNPWDYEMHCSYAIP